MDPRSAVDLALTGFAIAVGLSIVFDRRTWQASNRDWWGAMSPLRKRLVIAALVASIVQGLL